MLVGAGRPPERVVATAGNVTSAIAGRVAAGACRLLGLDAPVLLASGGEARLASPHGEDGFVGIADQLPAGRPGVPMDDLGGDLLVTAPLTVVATSATPGGRVLWQGGGFNEEADPAAAGAVECDVVPVHVAERVTIDADELDGPALLVEAVRRYGPVLHDAVAAVAWYRPELFVWEQRRAADVDVEAVRTEIASMLRSLS